MLPAPHRPLLIILGALAALGLSAYAVDDMSGLLQSKVDLPAQDQDDLDLEAAEAEITKEQSKAAANPPEIVKDVQAAPDPAAAQLSLSEQDTEGAADAEIEAMEAELALEGEDEEGEGEQGAEEQEEETEEMTVEKAKEALRQRIAERAKLAEASNYSFTVGSIVFVQGKKAKVAWDGRPDHEFVKVTWQEGPSSGKTSGIIPVEDCWLQASKVVEIGKGRHLKKRVTSSTQTQLEQKKKSRPRVKDTTRRRRSVIRRVVYGIKKMPMVITIPFKGLKTGVETIQSEMTAHTGLAFNGSLIDLLNVGSGSLGRGGSLSEDAMAMADEAQAKPRRPRKNITEIVRNKTYAAVMKLNEQHLQPLMTSFTNEIRIPELDGNLTNVDPALRR